jgi:hypothetical protein
MTNEVMLYDEGTASLNILESTADDDQLSDDVVSRYYEMSRELTSSLASAAVPPTASTRPQIIKSDPSSLSPSPPCPCQLFALLHP